MSEDYLIQAFWGARGESISLQAHRIGSTLERLSALHPLLANWRLLGKTRYHNFYKEREELLSIIKGVAIDFEDGKSSTSEGFQIGANNDEGRLSDKLVTLTIFTGRTFVNSSPVTNIFVMNFAALNPEIEPLIKVAMLKQIMWIVATDWEPQMMVVKSGGMASTSNMPKSMLRPNIEAGWITYVSSDLAPLIVPPVSSANEYNSDGSLVMVASQEPFLVDNPAHMAVLQDVQAALAPIEALPWPPGPEAKPGAFR
jgi:hypothetical protein